MSSEEEAEEDAEGPRYLQIADVLAEEVNSLGDGALLPSRERLRVRFGVSTLTIRAAIELLAARGMVVTGQGREPRVRRAPAWDLERSGYVATVLRSEPVPDSGAGPVSRIAVTMLLTVTDEPAALLIGELPEEELLAPEPTTLARSRLREAAFTALPAGGRMEEELRIGVATEEERRLLVIGRGLPVARLRRRSITDRDQVVRDCELVQPADTLVTRTVIPAE